MGRRLTKRTRRADSAQVLSGFASMEATGLRLTAELRGFAQDGLADALCDVIGQIRPIHAAAVARLTDEQPRQES